MPFQDAFRALLPVMGSFYPDGTPGRGSGVVCAGSELHVAQSTLL